MVEKSSRARAPDEDRLPDHFRGQALDRRQLKDSSGQAFPAPKVAATLWTLYEELQTRSGRPPSSGPTQQGPAPLPTEARSAVYSIMGMFTLS
jgi:hypothetical protein